MCFTSFDLDMRSVNKPRDEIYQQKFPSAFLMLQHKNLNFNQIAEHFETKLFSNIKYDKNAIQFIK
jgi:hypothetical protein